MKQWMAMLLAAAMLLTMTAGALADGDEAEITAQGSAQITGDNLRRTRQARYVVAKADFNQLRTWHGRGKMTIRTRLVVNSIPMMEFYHRVFDEAQTCYAEATVKIAAVDEQIRLLPDWESSISGQMSQFIINKGEIAT